MSKLIHGELTRNGFSGPVRAEIVRHRHPQSTASKVLGASHAMANRAPWIPEAQRVYWPQPEPDARERVWNYKLGLWELPEPPAIQEIEPPRRNPVPCGDGSGVFWDVCEVATRRAKRGQTGTRFWRIEARDFDAALEEKRRLCLGAGYRPGDTYLLKIV